MTAPSPETLDREKDKLLVTDTEIIRRLGVPYKIGLDTIRGLDSNPHSGFPPKLKMWGGRRYWPAVLAFVEHTAGFTMRVPQDRERDNGRRPSA